MYVNKFVKEGWVQYSFWMGRHMAIQFNSYYCLLLVDFDDEMINAISVIIIPREQETRKQDQAIIHQH